MFFYKFLSKIIVNRLVLLLLITLLLTSGACVILQNIPPRDPSLSSYKTPFPTQPPVHVPNPAIRLSDLEGMQVEKICLEVSHQIEPANAVNYMEIQDMVIEILENLGMTVVDNGQPCQLTLTVVTHQRFSGVSLRECYRGYGVRATLALSSDGVQHKQWEFEKGKLGESIVLYGNESCKGNPGLKGGSTPTGAWEDWVVYTLGEIWGPRVYLISYIPSSMMDHRMVEDVKSDEEYLLQLAQKLQDPDKGRYALRLIRRGLGAEAAPVLPYVLPYLNSMDYTLRIEAAQAVGFIGPEAITAVPVLIYNFWYATTDDDIPGEEDYLAALKQITGVSYSDWRSYRDWWNENKHTPVEPTEEPPVEPTEEPPIEPTEEPPVEGLSLGLSLSTLNNPFYVTLRDGAQAAADASGVELVVVDAQNDPAKEATNIEDLIRQGVSVIMVNPTDADAVVPSIHKANEAGIPVFTIDRRASGGTIVSHIASDNVAGGMVAGKFLCEALGGEGKVVELEGIAGTSAARDRGQGFNDYMSQECTGVEIVARQTANFNRAEGLTVFENILVAEPEIDGTFAHNDEMILGAIEAAEAANRADVIIFVGFDAVDDALQAVRDEKLAATVMLQPSEMGRLGVEVAVRFLSGEQVETYIPVDLSLVTIDNVQ